MAATNEARQFERGETIQLIVRPSRDAHVLPASLGARDFAPPPVASLEQVRSAFSHVAGGALAHESFQFRAR